MIDGHIHFAESMDSELLNRMIEEYGLEAIALQCIPKGGRLPVEKDALMFRGQSPVPVYVFGGLARDIFEFPKEHLTDALYEEAKRLLGMGCSGIKMLEGKPDVRKNYPVPDFDDMVWEKYWTFLEEMQVPIVFHVNDPEGFWDEELVTEFARKAGWFYDDSFISNEAQYCQIENVLERHPELNILFPHFLFFSRRLSRLAELLRKYPNMMIDVTPGAEQYYNLSDRIMESRSFFEEFKGRICYGTDIGARAVIKEEEVPLCLEECHARIAFIRAFLENKGEYIQSPDGFYITEGTKRVMHGLGIEKPALDMIYRDNFMTFLKKTNYRGDVNE